MNAGPVTEVGHAKLNLTLEILGQRSDGYHNISSLMTTVTLGDRVTVEDADEITVAAEGLDLAEGNNLAYKVAQALKMAAGVSKGARITIEKSIPVSAGLGGGSADAAATLRALDRLWGLGIPKPQLAEIGAGVGSDIPFLVHEGAALVQGRGEDVVAVPKPNLGRVLLLCPSIDVPRKTAEVFGRVQQSMFTRGTLTHKLAARVRGGGDCPSAFFFNAFGPLAEEVFPGWAEYRDGLAALGAADITLTGAGPSMFAVPPSKEMGTAWQLLLTRTRGWNAFLVEPYDPGEDRAH